MKTRITKVSDTATMLSSILIAPDGTPIELAKLNVLPTGIPINLPTSLSMLLVILSLTEVPTGWTFEEVSA